MKLTETQKRNLKDHVYKSQGCSLLEQLFLSRFWSCLVTMCPIWLAPNLITFVGFIIGLGGSLSVILQDWNCTGEAPCWALIFCAASIFIYQTMDGCDGKQARRINCCNSLGELFDHGCDAILTILYAIAAGCTSGLVEHPYLLLLLVFMIMFVCYIYHWQAYVSGILYFKYIDVAEAHYAQITALLLTCWFGSSIWDHKTLAFLGIPFTLKVMFVSGTVFFTITNALSALYIICTQGVGKNGSTVAGTSVVSPIFTPVLILGVAVGYVFLSPGRLLESHCVLTLVALVGPLCKAAVNMMLAAMVKSPFPLVDPIMIGPMIALANVYCGAMLPEFYLLVGIALFNIYNILSLCVGLCLEFSETLNVPIFTVPSKKTD